MSEYAHGDMWRGNQGCKDTYKRCSEISASLTTLLRVMRHSMYVQRGRAQQCNK